jgi:hypothetical protein
MLFNEKEVIDAIASINSDIFEKTDNEFIELELKTNGMGAIIYFCGIQIWFSEEDERDEINENGDHEPLEPFLRKRVNEIIELFIKIKSI